MAAVAACPLFRLPAELRNYIYELTFATPPTIDFIEACPPSKALVVTCRAIRDETAKMYQAMYRKYWKESTFVIDMFDRLPVQGPARKPGDDTYEEPVEYPVNRGKQAAVYAKVEDIPAEDLANISRVYVYDKKNHRQWTFGILRDGEWANPNVESDSRLIPPLYTPIEKRAELEAAGFLVGVISASRSLDYVCTYHLDREAVERAKKIIGRSGLEREELMTVIRTAVRDWVRG